MRICSAYSSKMVAVVVSNLYCPAWYFKPSRKADKCQIDKFNDNTLKNKRILLCLCGYFCYCEPEDFETDSILTFMPPSVSVMS